MGVVYKALRGYTGKNRKELLLSNQEKKLIQFAKLVYPTDETTIIRLLLRRGIIDLIAEVKKSGVPKISKEMENLLEE